MGRKSAGQENRARRKLPAPVRLPGAALLLSGILLGGILFGAAAFSGCVLPAKASGTPQARESGSDPALVKIAAVNYRLPSGERIGAEYRKLSDDTLGFVRLTLPDGTRAALPRLVSASGSRYSDEMRWQWWTKGSTAFLQERNGEGDWVMRYPDCLQEEP